MSLANQIFNIKNGCTPLWSTAYLTAIFASLHPYSLIKV